MRTEVLSLLGPGSHLCASVTCSVHVRAGVALTRAGRVSTGGRRLLGLLALAVLAHMWLLAAASDFRSQMQIQGTRPVRYVCSMQCR